MNNNVLQWIQGGFLQLSFWQSVVLTLVLTHITIVSVTLFLHRAQSHLSLKLHPALSHFFRLWLWLTTGMVTKEWVATHRKHHTRADMEEDPHSPITKGIYRVLFEGAELYQNFTKKREEIERYGKGTPDDCLERNVYSKFPRLGIAYMLIINAATMGLSGVMIWSVQMMWIPFFAAGVINGIGHYLGYRNFRTYEHSHNISPLGLLIGGEELHNNHHAYPHSARFSTRRFEFDVGWFYICILKFFGLVQVVSVYQKAVLHPHKKNIDLQTLEMVVKYRFEMIAWYINKIYIPVLKAEKEKLKIIGITFRKAKNLFLFQENMLSEKDNATLQKILQHSKTLMLLRVYQQNLQSIWENTQTNQVMVQKLKFWHECASKSEIHSLVEYAKCIPQMSG